jgi:hypothetical protein
MRIGLVSFRVLALVVAGTLTMASSGNAQGRLRGNMRLGAEFGGERVLQFTYEDGSTPDVTSGGGLLISAGGAFQAFKSGGHEMDAQINLGWKYRTIPKATNQEATWSRFPLEALVFYRAPFGLRVGGGAAVHLGNVLEASGAVLNSRVAFKNKPGFVLQTEYGMRNNLAVDVRYTLMTYEVESGGSGTVNANSFGAGFSYFFGRSAAATVKEKATSR